MFDKLPETVAMSEAWGMYYAHLLYSKGYWSKQELDTLVKGLLRLQFKPFLQVGLKRLLQLMLLLLLLLLLFFLLLWLLLLLLLLVVVLLLLPLLLLKAVLQKQIFFVEKVFRYLFPHV